MQTFRIEETETRFEVIPTNDEPRLIVTTDFEDVGVIPSKSGNAGMIQAINGISAYTGCAIIRVARANAYYP